MTIAPTATQIGYFGKIPSRGDFVKATTNVPLVGVLDDWLAKTMDLLAADPRWKLTYDTVCPLHFAFLGPRSKRAVAGHLIASSDQAHRRFPFLAVGSMEIDAPPRFVTRSPLVLSRLWNRLETQMAGVMAAEDATDALHTIATNQISLEICTPGYDAAFQDFLEAHTVSSLDLMLGQAGFTGSARQLILALGLLLQPVMSSTSSRLDKSLVLPLPADPMYRYLVATCWMHLATPFLMRADFELSMFLTKLNNSHVMVLGFSGASSRTLHAIMEPQAAVKHHIAFDDAEWVEDQLASDYGVRKLATYLAQPGFSLKSAHNAFLEAFIGV
jgi:type VI secretion system protein ImpM